MGFQLSSSCAKIKASTCIYLQIKQYSKNPKCRETIYKNKNAILPLIEYRPFSHKTNDAGALRYKN